MNQYYRLVCAHSILFHSTFRQEWVLLSQPPQKSCLCDFRANKDQSSALSNCVSNTQNLSFCDLNIKPHRHIRNKNVIFLLQQPD